MLALTLGAIFIFLAALGAWEARARLMWLLEIAINTLTGARRAGKNNFYLQKIYAPACEEVLEDNLSVDGDLPSDLDGAFLRIGPNPYFAPTGDYHLFDGDGMIHALRIKSGKAYYSNQWVETSRLKQERKAGHPLFPKFGDLMGRRALISLALAWLKRVLGVMDDTEGAGTANTALTFHHESLLALHEGDMPYRVRVFDDGRQQTIGRMTFGGTVAPPFTAHPKIHPRTGELVGFGWRSTKPFLHYFLLDPEGKPQVDFPIEIPEPVMMHDFAITEDYVIFLDFPLIFRPQGAIATGGDVFVFDHKRATRFGVMPRNAKSGKEVRWYEMESMFAFHVANAWQEGPLIKLYAAISQEKQLGTYKQEFWMHPEGHPFITEITINTETGQTSRRKICDTVCEFPTVPVSLVGQRSRYTYIAESGTLAKGGDTFFVGITKVDLMSDAPERAVAGRILYGGWRVGGEPIFVPRAEPKGEDDGYLLTFVTDVQSGASSFHVYDAATMADAPVCRVSIPQRIPYGFHALHITEKQLQAQLPLHLQIQSVASDLRMKMSGSCAQPISVGFADSALRL